MDFDLERFVKAQEGVYDGVLGELRAGRKTGHWIWFIFPQVAGLGRSEMSRFYGIASLDEARAYLDHPVLGPRLRECVHAVLATSGASADQIFGSLDAMKVRSSMTLFHRAAPGEPLFREVLERFYGGVADAATDAMLTVPEAARRAGRNPETIRRWIREGKLRARKVGTQHVLEEADLAEMIGAGADTVELPPEWQRTFWGGPMPDVVAAVRRSRAGH
jgi:excisionase family DNA binding protein